MLAADFLAAKAARSAGTRGRPGKWQSSVSVKRCARSRISVSSPGTGRYVDDIDLPQQAYGVTVLSPHAHARISSVNVSKAQAAPGVFCVLTGADCATDKLGAFTAHPMPEEVGAPPGHRTWLPLLNADKVRYVGDRVAFVVAETLIQARDAAELVEVEYEQLPAVVDVEDAAKEGARKVWDDNQKATSRSG